MDFHSLARRELQALCKKNKIPANITNIAMADALKALDIVEGLEEYYNPSSVVSPGKTVMASPYVPCTGGRTSTRKKTIKEKSGSVQITTRTRRGTKSVSEEVEDAKIDVVETQGNKSIHKPVASGIQEMETPRNYKEEISVRKMNTLRSTMLEKKMMELKINDKEGIEPIDFGASDREMPNDDMEGNVKEDSDDFGLNQETISVDDVLLKIDEEALSDEAPVRELEQVSEVLDDDNDDGTKTTLGEGSEEYRESDILPGENLEKSQDLKYEVPKEDDRTDQNVVDDNDDARAPTKLGEASEEYGESDNLAGEKLEKSQDIEYEVPKEEDENAAVAADDDNDDRAQTKLGEGSKEYGQSDVFPGENFEKSHDLKYEVPKEEGCDDSGCIDNTTHHLMSRNHEEGFNAGKNEGSKDWYDILNHMVDDLVSEEDSEKTEFGILSFSVSSAYQKQDITELQNQTINESEMKSVTDLDSTLTDEDILKEGLVVTDDAEVEFDRHGHSICYKRFGKEKEITLVTPNCVVDSSEPDIESSYEVQPTAVESNDEVNCPPLREDSEKIEIGILSLSVSDTSEYQKQDAELQNQTINESGMKYVNDLDSTLTGNFGSLIAGNHGTRSPCCLADSTSAADDLLQIGSVSDCLICPSSLTLLNKPSNKIPTTISRKIDNFLDGNKENIENSGMKLDLIKENRKKDNSEAPDSNNKLSLRQLKKKYKERVQITKKHINEDKDFAQVGGARPALQTLSENRLAASEPEMMLGSDKLRLTGAGL